jgi:hypothetical protein
LLFLLILILKIGLFLNFKSLSDIARLAAQPPLPGRFWISILSRQQKNELLLASYTALRTATALVGRRHHINDDRKTTSR